YFGTAKLKLTAHALKAIGPAATRTSQPGAAPAAGGEAVECYTYDPGTGANSSFSGFQQAVCIIAKDPLKPNTEYEVSLTVDVEGKPWTKTWRFSTGGSGGGSGHGPRTKTKR
ncbi:MAG: hypothetical protein NTW87_23810, partial [Planctomycetota bacterium]|nr:hypothetical protein [Planctomycetota bacterium]